MIYLDHAAATPVSERVFEAMEPYFVDKFFNPSAAYLPAKEVAADYETAKAVIAHAVGVKASDLVITAGATEANNLAFTSLSTEARCDSGEPLAPSSSGRSSRPSLRGSSLGPRRNCGFPSEEVRKGSLTCPRTVLYLATEHDSVRRVAEG